MIKDRQGNVIRQGEKQNNLLKKLYGTSLGRCALKILVMRWVSALGGMYMSSRLSTRHIQSFIQNNGIDMSDYMDENYKSYNEFFTRRIQEGKRPIDDDESILIAPADSKVTYYPIEEDSHFEIKDTFYSLQDLFDDPLLAKDYLHGTCLVFRLAVDDYHRYSFIDEGKVIKTKKIPGVFHTVNPIANDYYPIYKMNSREYTVIETKNFGTIVQMEVGAMMVGKIINHDCQSCCKGQEKGYFEFGGSTVVVVFKNNCIELDQDIIENSKHNIETKVRLGQKIGVRKDV